MKPSPGAAVLASHIRDMQQQRCPLCDGVEWVCENHPEPPWTTKSPRRCSLGSSALRSFGAGQRRVFVLKLTIEGLQFLIDRLHFLLGGLKLFIGRLQFLIDGLHFLRGQLRLLHVSFEFTDGGLDLGLGCAQLVCLSRGSLPFNRRSLGAANRGKLAKGDDGQVRLDWFNNH